MPVQTSFGALELRSSRQRELAQAVPRPARVRYFVLVTGVGEAQAPLDFGVMFMEEPTFSFGVASQTTIGTGSFPLATAVVLTYTLNEYGLWVGCNMGFRVDSASAGIELKFSLTFEGVATRTTSLTRI